MLMDLSRWAHQPFRRQSLRKKKVSSLIDDVAHLSFSFLIAVRMCVLGVDPLICEGMSKDLVKI